MNATDEQTEAIDEIARLLPQRAGQLGRLLWRHARGPLHRGMASALGTLAHGPQTIGRLAEIEGVAQPTMTRMVGRLELEGLVERTRSADDRRVVLVALTPHGREELTALRDRYRVVLRERLAGLTPAQLQALLDAAGAIEVLIDALRAADVSPQIRKSHSWDFRIATIVQALKLGTRRVRLANARLVRSSSGVASKLSSALNPR